jgi:hypothetical protein
VADAVEEVLSSVCSFSGDTLVATPDGEQAIGSLQVGDRVLAYDQASATTGIYPITTVLANDDPVVEDLTIDGEEIQSTTERPLTVRMHSARLTSRSALPARPDRRCYTFSTRKLQFRKR